MLNRFENEKKFYKLERRFLQTLLLYKNYLTKSYDIKYKTCILSSKIMQYLILYILNFLRVQVAF